MVDFLGILVVAIIASVLVVFGQGLYDVVGADAGLRP